MRRLVIIFILILLVSFAFYYIKFNIKKPPKEDIEISGTIETTEVDMSFQIPGRIAEIFCNEGDKVKKGEMLARLDDRDLLQQIAVVEAQKNTIIAQIPQLKTKIETSKLQEKRELEQAKARVDQAFLQYESLRKGSREEQIAQGKYLMMQALHNLKNAEREFQRAESLYKEGAMPGQKRDAQETAFLVAKEQYRQARENYKLLLAGPRREDIDAAFAALRQAKAAYNLTKTKELQTKQLIQQFDILNSQIRLAEENIKQAKLQLRHTKLYSPIDGVVLVRSREPGEVVAASSPIITIADINKVYLKAYISERYHGKIRLGEKVEITTDSFPEKKYDGKIYYISDEAEFTPKNLTTKEDRVKLVYRIKVEVANPNEELKPGMIADGIIRK